MFHRKSAWVRIYLVIMGAVRKRGAFLDEIIYPWSVKRMRQIDVAGLDKRTDRHGTRHLSAFRVYRKNAADLVLQHLNDGRPVCLVLNQLGKSGGPLLR